MTSTVTVFTAGDPSGLALAVTATGTTIRTMRTTMTAIKTSSDSTHGRKLLNSALRSLREAVHGVDLVTGQRLILLAGVPGVSTLLSETLLAVLPALVVVSRLAAVRLTLLAVLAAVGLARLDRLLRLPVLVAVAGVGSLSRFGIVRIVWLGHGPSLVPVVIWTAIVFHGSGCAAG
ncbi:hypothetical protein QP028_10755 [Corynebacterium suedekumii]|nr:hypothetical protein QP028_10755 [Corynebacterium suedekumii]